MFDFVWDRSDKRCCSGGKDRERYRSCDERLPGSIWTGGGSASIPQYYGGFILPVCSKWRSSLEIDARMKMEIVSSLDGNTRHFFHIIV